MSDFPSASNSLRRVANRVCVLGILLVATACQTPVPNPHAPLTRLEPLLEEWDEARREDGGCEQRRPRAHENDSGSALIRTRRISQQTATNLGVL